MNLNSHFNLTCYKQPPSLCLVLITCFLGFAPVLAQNPTEYQVTPVLAPVTTDYQVTAVFLFRFAEFVQWPPDAFADPKSPIIIGVLGANPFNDALSQAVQGERVGGRRLVVRYFQQVQEVGSCQILFISSSEASKLPAILAALKGRSILTASDAGSFIAQGGMIEFSTQENRVQFKINRTAAEAAKLKLSSKLLRLAE